MRPSLAAVIPIVVIVVVGSLLALFLVKNGNVSSLEGGVQMGYVPALLTWAAFLASLVAVAGFLLYAGVALGSRVLKSLATKKYIAIAALCILVVVLGVQYGTDILAPLERGVVDGVAPPSLAWVAALLTLFTNVGFVVFVTRRGPEGRPNLSAGVVSASSTGGATVTLTKQPHGEPLPSKTVEVVLGDPQDAAMLAGGFEQGKRSGYDRDAIQTRNNIAEWILSYMTGEQKINKSELEQRFSEQFPRTLWPLFNSVVYDLIYQNKLVSSKEGGSEQFMLQKHQNEETRARQKK